MKKRINGRDVTHVDSETGEIICKTRNCTSISDNEKSQREKEQEEYNNSHVLNFNEGENFVKMYTEITYKLSLILPPKEYVTAIALANFVSYENNALVNGYGNKQHYMDLKEISDVLETDYTRISRIMNSLIKKGIFGQFTIGNMSDKKVSKYYIANPYIYINGRNPSLEIMEYFTKSGWREFINSANVECDKE